MATRDPYSQGTTGSGTGSATGSSMGEQAQGVVDQVQQVAGQVAGQAKQQAVSQVETQKGQAAEGLGTVAEAARGLGDQLREKDQAGLAGYVDQAAERIEHFSEYVRSTDVNDILGDAQQFARRQPSLFLGGAFLVGLAASRFLRSTAPAMGSRSTGRPGGMSTRGTFSGQYASGYDRRTGSTPTYGAAPRSPGAPSVGTAPSHSGSPASSTAPYTAGPAGTTPSSSTTRPPSASPAPSGGTAGSTTPAQTTGSPSGGAPATQPRPAPSAPATGGSASTTGTTGASTPSGTTRPPGSTGGR